MTHRRGFRQAGQSTILLAFLIVVIIGMIGLAVDVGNAFGQQRRVQSVTNAGALAGMSTALRPNVTNTAVWTDVQRVLTGNRVDAGPTYSYRVDYITDNERVELLGEWDGQTDTATLPRPNAQPPQPLVRVQVTMTERIPTYFASVLGQDELTVNANAVACLGDYGTGVFPLGVPVQRLPSGGSTVRLAVANNNDFVSGVHVSWLNWGGATQTIDGKTYTALSGKQGASALDAAFTAPGTLQDGFLEAKSPDSSKPNTKPMAKLQRGDWIAGDPGVKASLKDELEVLRLSGAKITLPIYDVSAESGTGVKVAYHMSNMGKFVIGNYELTGSPKYIDLQYLGDAPNVPEACGSEALPTASDKRFNISGQANVQRVYRSFTSSNSTTYDIVLVMDTSDSMAWDWNDRKPGESGYSSSNARINDAKRVIRDFVQNFDLTTATGDPDARIAFVTFGGTAPGKVDYAEGRTTPSGYDPAVVQQGWTTACAADQIADDCGASPTLKWATIQTQAAAMTPRGLTPGPIAFEEIENLLNSRRTPPSGKNYEQVVIFATDGVFNVCGSTVGTRNCPYGEVVPFDNTAPGGNVLYYLNNPGYNLVSGRPVWQAQQVSSRIRASGARVFVVALTPQCLPGNSTGCFDPAGLKDMSSGTGYYYQANDTNAINSIFGTIREKIVYDQCLPQEVTEEAPGATVILKRPDNPTWSIQTTTDASGAYVFQNLSAGEYVVRVDPPLSLSSPEDGLTRTYSRLRNNLSLSEETQASVYINPQYPNGATEYSSILLSLPLASDDAPNNGCTLPATP